ncbi:hypothetical protein [Leminorella grimontii]|uniref:hypothetical protein n=1 Tax=Leminorella grimontii TaxID=82981 RepID=UPI00321FFFFF
MKKLLSPLIADMTESELIAFLDSKDLKLPSWMTAPERLKNSRPMTPEELQEYAEICSGLLRTNAALSYLIYCGERFGKRDNGFVFQCDNIVIAIDRDVIELLLQAQVESALLEIPDSDGYLHVMNFYLMNQREEENRGGPWLNKFIDDFLKDSAVLLLSGELQPPPPAAIH